MKKHLKQIQQIVRISLSDIEMHSKSAENLLMGTGAVESRFEYLRQVGGSGIARSWWQIEPDTAFDNIHSWLGFRKKRLKELAKSCFLDETFLANLDLGQATSILTYNLKFACQMARIKYYRVPKPLPDADDVEGLGEYWLRYYNTGGKWGKGKGSIDKWMEAQKLLK